MQQRRTIPPFYRALQATNVTVVRSIIMISNNTRSRDKGAFGSFTVALPRTSDRICGALHAAFGCQDQGLDDFAALLQQIDIADRKYRAAR